MKCRFVGRKPDELAGGRPLVYGDIVEVKISEPHNQRLVAEGLLLPLAEKKAEEKRRKNRKQEDDES